MKRQFFNQDMSLGEIKNQLVEFIKSPTTYTAEEIIDAILVATMNEIDFNLADKLCSTYVMAADNDVQRMAITGMGHVARVYGKEVNENSVKLLQFIVQNANNPLYEEADSALSDMEIFLKKHYLPKYNENKI